MVLYASKILLYVTNRVLNITLSDIDTISF